ncbi:hypothetical protein B0H11DRAFT_2348674 [Mycena galericulata]|nr:hypothetical protein B0H11DRAFT_2348674 [Mycena galericulata]
MVFVAAVVMILAGRLSLYYSVVFACIPAPLLQCIVFSLYCVGIMKYYERLPVYHLLLKIYQLLPGLSGALPAATSGWGLVYRATPAIGATGSSVVLWFFTDATRRSKKRRPGKPASRWGDSPNWGSSLPPGPTTSSLVPSNASTYPPANGQTRPQYESRLTTIAPKAPLQPACSSLGLKFPASANLERLKAELAKHWFSKPATVGHAQRVTHATSSRSSKKSRTRATDAHDVLKSVLAPNSGTVYTVTAPSGSHSSDESRTTVQHRSEFRGGVPLLSTGPSTSRQVPPARCEAAPSTLVPSA